ncbi:hypothetical protein ACJRO7_010657 [Eucalyptus globulus]|uniref:Uncharacterized protein n=1 Tax=Eucalyptus globulus TaxID=34317 RepID=A0ABD3LCT8_EUCGL
MDRSWSRVSVVWIDPCTVRIDPGRAGSIVVEGLGRVDRSTHRAVDHGSIMVEGLGRAGSIVVEGLGHVDRSWIDPGRAGSIVADRLGRVDRSDRCMDRSWIGPGRAGSIPAPCGSIVDRSRSTGIGRGRPPRPCGSIRSVHG